MAPPQNDDVTTKPEELSPGMLARIERTAVDKLSKLLGIPEKPDAEKIHRLTPKQEAQLRRIEEKAIAEFHGDMDQLESALGMLRMGHHFGWRVLYIIHSKRTIRNYERILHIRIRDIFEPTGPSTYRSIGFNVADRVSNFWKAIGGEMKIPRRKDAIK